MSQQILHTLTVLEHRAKLARETLMNARTLGLSALDLAPLVRESARARSDYAKAVYGELRRQGRI